jgi:hypothetical protein
MLQLSLDFLGWRSNRLPPASSTPAAPKQPLAWKHGITVHLIRHPRARRYLLRLQSDGSARLVIPRRGTQAEALRFLEHSEAWLLKQSALWHSRNQTRLPWTDGTRFPFRGHEVALHVTPANGRIELAFADERFSLPCQLPDYREVVLGHLRRIAERELPPRTRALADRLGIKINRVTVRAQKTRWGSCSTRGAISLNWRLIQTPPEVVDYLIIHELMHRREMNHSKRYWKLVADAFPAYREAEKWLKKSRLETMA